MSDRGLVGAAVLSFLSCSVATAGQMPSASEVVAAERAFAADAQARGYVAAFKKYAAPEAIGFQPDVVNFQKSLENEPNEPADRTLKWWPVWAGIAQSGELGFTTGPYSSGEKRFGYYFTVWAKQDDGSWRWIYDGGARHDAKAPLGPETEPALLPTANAASGTAEKAWAEVGQRETALADAAARDAKAAYIAALSSDAHIMGSTAQPATDRDSRAAELERRSATIAFSALGGRASKAGDLVYTYGDANWVRDGEPGRGHYVRIWQKRSEGWVLVFDEILVVPPPKKPTP